MSISRAIWRNRSPSNKAEPGESKVPQSIFTPETLTKRSWKHFAASYSLELLGIFLATQIAWMAPQVVEHKKDLGPITWIAPTEEVTPPPPQVHIEPPPQQIIRRRFDVHLRRRRGH